MNFKKFLKKAINYTGYEIYSLPIKKNDEYSGIYPHSTYSPWLNNLEFQKTYNIIKDYTLVDIYRCYELWNFSSQTKKLDGDILEVGVWKGGTAGIIANSMLTNGINKKLYLADTFEGVVKAGTNDNYYTGGEHFDTSIDIVNELIREKLHFNSFEILKGIFPDDTSTIINERSICFCHIDVDTYNSAKDIFDWVWCRIVKGGFVIFDDYGFFECSGVAKYVDEISTEKDRIFIHNLNGHAIFIKI